MLLHRRPHDERVARMDGQVRGPVRQRGAGPGQACVGRAVNAQVEGGHDGLPVRQEAQAEAGGRRRRHGAVLPGGAAVGAAPEAGARADVRLARAHEDEIGVQRTRVEGADPLGVEGVGEGRPDGAVELPHAAAGGGHTAEAGGVHVDVEDAPGVARRIGAEHAEGAGADPGGVVAVAALGGHGAHLAPDRVLQLAAELGGIGIVPLLEVVADQLRAPLGLALLLGLLERRLRGRRAQHDEGDQGEREERKERQQAASHGDTSAVGGALLRRL